MASHMKTTVQISDALLADIHKIVVKRKTTLKALVDEGLRHVVETESAAKKPFKMKDASVGGNGLVDELKNASWSDIVAMSYGDRSG
jgi:hypothetical protein